MHCCRHRKGGEARPLVHGECRACSALSKTWGARGQCSPCVTCSSPSRGSAKPGWQREGGSKALGGCLASRKFQAKLLWVVSCATVAALAAVRTGKGPLAQSPALGLRQAFSLVRHDFHSPSVHRPVSSGIAADRLQIKTISPQGPPSTRPERALYTAGRPLCSKRPRSRPPSR